MAINQHKQLAMTGKCDCPKTATVQKKKCGGEVKKMNCGGKMKNGGVTKGKKC